ncbi:MAG: UDP-N-acetylglucosamine 1-carboxyvinyltransferase [Chloroflexota bacterium]|nr:UDP-N-acetylglucosamine 1-carboxyvinyltransferase [Chloroflexota bacterium]MDE3102161.1 UDP-N-acetylglucosamine 1-carboxyvinyltransferase [Chloroflexota bacterium]
MSRFVVEGGVPLRGEITAAGNKNAGLPLIAASLLTSEPVTLRNLPRIRDVHGMLEILCALGAEVHELDAHSVTISTANVNRTELDRKLSGEIRTSLLFAGPMLARFKKVTIPHSGGDAIGRRRTDTHWLALGALGARLDPAAGGYRLETEGLEGADVLLDEASVTATENALLSAARTPGRTVIRNAASEPHVQELAMVLVQMGARIHGIGTNTIEVKGVDELRGVDHEVWSDHIEVGSLMVLAAITHGEVTIRRCAPTHLQMTRAMFRRLGVETEIRGDDLIVPRKDRYVVEEDMGGKIPSVKSGLWPGFPSDLTSMATAMATQCAGTVLIHEWLFEARMFWVGALEAMGARLVLCDPHRVVIVGPSQLYGSEIRSPDIRAGLALLAAALCAKGTSRIDNIEQIDRGYEAIDERLRALGARITRE